jgi:phosphoserine phosphatase RsbU/P
LQLQYDNLCRDVEAAAKIYSSLCQDLQAAARLQQSLLPPPAKIGRYQSDWLFLPAAFLAGDMFGYYPIDDRHLGFFQIDVSGHGVQAALFSFSVSQTLTPARDAYGFLKRPLSKPPFYTLTSPSTVARELNRHFASTEDTGIYFTMVYGLLDQESGRATLVQAGHPYPLRWDHAAGRIERIGKGGFAVGMLPGLDFDTVSFDVCPGDRLFVYSDGIVECANPAGDLFSLERLEAFIARNAQASTHDLIEALRSELQAWRQSDQFDDDISLLVLEKDQG